MMVLKIGSRGPQVTEVQMRLNDLGYTIDQVDGVFGSGTQQAVWFFQHQHGLVASGELTGKQRELLFSDNAQKASPIAGVHDPITEAEMKAVLAVLKPVMEESDEERRYQILGKAIMKYGLRLMRIVAYIHKQATGDMKEPAASLEDLATKVFLSWLGGEVFTDRADEDELRAMVAMDALEAGGLGMVRLAARSILRLPVDHPLRDIKSLRAKLLTRAQECRDTALWDSFILVGETLLNEDLLAEPEAQALADELVRLAEDPTDGQKALDDDDRRWILVRVAGWHMTQSLAHRDEGSDAASTYRAASVALMRKAQKIRLDPKDVLILAVTLDENNQTEEAAELLAPLADSRENGYETAAWMEALFRLRLGHYERCVEVLERIVPREEERYLLATGDEKVKSMGERYTSDAIHLSFGYAFLGKWAQAIDTIDRVKSPRLRHAMKLRQSSTGTKLLKLEAQLASASRGVPDSDIANVDKEKDPMGSRLSAATHALENYRKSRPELSTTSLTPPTLSEVGSALKEDEAVVCMGSSFKGLMMGVILHGDTDSPSGRFLLKELPKSRVVELLCSTGEISGWALELVAFEPVAPESALETFLMKTDNAFGKQLAEFLSTHRIRKVTIIPHRVLHVIPFWAVPSLRKFDVRTAPSMAQWFQSREKVHSLNMQATAVGNPTLDLCLATAEAESLKALLAQRGCKTDVLVEKDAKETAIRDSVRGSGILHFAGHGLAKLMQPLLSALLTHPDEKWGWPAGGDPLTAIANKVPEWVVTSDGTRYADLAEGRLVEYTDDQGEIVERRLEHAATGTLWGRYDRNRLLHLAELWTTSDILTEDSFANCSLAFLGACESGQAAFRTGIDEDVGLPSALQLAEVNTVVCTLWPVGDVAALLFAGIFYHHLIAQPKGTVDLASMVATSRADLASINRDDASAMLREATEETTSRATKAQLEYVIGEMSSGPELPFAHPYHWAAFFAQGAEHVNILWD